MIYMLPAFIKIYWYYLLGAAAVCVALSLYSERFYGALKKAILIFLVVFVAAAGYEFFTGNSIISLPGSVERKLSEDPGSHETGRRYYKSYEERYGEKPPDD